jgi:signal transduction histidine kinase
MLVLVQVPQSIDAVMLFVATERTYDYAALKFAEDYGERIGAALNNARLYRKVKQALHARDEFLTLAAHELRTPFTSLRIACERLMAESEGVANPAVVTSAQRILRQSRRLTRLVNRMLDASLAERRVSLVQLQEVDLVPLVREVVDELRTTSRQSTIELTVPPAVIGRWDADRLQEVASNLIENAVKYGSDQPIRVTLAVEGDTAVLSVADRGIGIDPKVIPRLFEPYERGVSSKGYGGLGLGLFISREIVAAHGGTIEVTSELGVGSEFRARLPGVISASRLE